MRHVGAAREPGRSARAVPTSRAARPARFAAASVARARLAATCATPILSFVSTSGAWHTELLHGINTGVKTGLALTREGWDIAEIEEGGSMREGYAH